MAVESETERLQAPDAGAGEEIAERSTTPSTAGSTSLVPEEPDNVREHQYQLSEAPIAD